MKYIHFDCKSFKNTICLSVIKDFTAHQTIQKNEQTANVSTLYFTVGECSHIYWAKIQIREPQLTFPQRK